METAGKLVDDDEMREAMKEGSGVGLVERMTGLPIGHHYITVSACESTRHGINASRRRGSGVLRQERCGLPKRESLFACRNISELVGKTRRSAAVA
jgi:hypothetical protein